MIAQDNPLYKYWRLNSEDFSLTDDHDLTGGEKSEIRIWRSCQTTAEQPKCLPNKYYMIEKKRESFVFLRKTD